MIKESAIAVSLFAFTTFVNAGSWSSTVNVTKLYPYNGGLIFNTDYVNTNISTCDNGTRYSISIDHPNYQVLASAMMAAFMAGNKVVFNINDQNPSCMPTINRFMVVK